MNRGKFRRKPMAEINVVPYIDVMLVLLIIFMITAPLMTPGVEVQLPQADASPVDTPENHEPVIITVDSEGAFYLNIGEEKDSPISAQTLMNRIAAVIKYKPGTPVMVRGDEAVPYGEVVQVMVLAQKAGVPSVGLLTESPDAP